MTQTSTDVRQHGCLTGAPRTSAARVGQRPACHPPANGACGWRPLSRDCRSSGCWPHGTSRSSTSSRCSGPLWLVFQPLALLAPSWSPSAGSADVESGVPYTVFALVGLSAWAFFQASMTIGTASLITNFELVRFTPCPRLAFPIAGDHRLAAILRCDAAARSIAAAVDRRRCRPRRRAPAARAGVALPAHGGLVASRSPLRRAVSGHALRAALPPSGRAVPRSRWLPAVRALLRRSGHLVDLNPLTGLIEALALDDVCRLRASFEPIGDLARSRRP